jgi:hypothetical protein
MTSVKVKLVLAGLVLGLSTACEEREFKTIVSNPQPQVAEPTRPILLSKPGTNQCTQEFIDAAVEISESTKNLKNAFESEDFISPDVVLERADEVVEMCNDLLPNLIDINGATSCEVMSNDGPQTEISLSSDKVKADCKTASEIQKSLQVILK